MRFLSKHKRHGDENGVEGGKERIVPSRGFDPVVRILEYELSSSVFTLEGLDSGFLVWRTMETKMRSSLRKNFLFLSLFFCYTIGEIIQRVVCRKGRRDYFRELYIISANINAFSFPFLHSLV